MEKKKQTALAQIIGLGIISGMRTTFAPALLSHYLGKKDNATLSKSKLAFIRLPVAAKITKLLSAGEMVGDKLPNTPNRTVTSQVMARTASGAFAGAVICAVNGNSIAKGALTGGCIALAATYGTFYLRKFIAENTFIKEPATGAVEDAIAIGTGVLLMR